MILQILILVSSILFLAKFLSYKFPTSTKKFLLSSSTMSTNPSTSPKDVIVTSYMEKEEDLKRVFDAFDKNGDGFITREELKESLNNMGIFMQIKEVESVLDGLDSNKDGLIDLSEFMDLYELVKKKEDLSRGGDNHDYFVNDCDIKEAFDVFDEDKDGLITIEELGLVLSSLGLKEGKYRNEDCKEMISRVDVDGDGMVNFDEFKMMMKIGVASSNSN